MRKEFSKAIINRTRLRNDYLRKRSDGNRKKNLRTWNGGNYYVPLLRGTKRNITAA